MPSALESGPSSLSLAHGEETCQCLSSDEITALLSDAIKLRSIRNHRHHLVLH